MGINTLTPRYLNLDNDSRIVAAQEMVDALNVRVSADENGNQGVVKNIKGNTSIDSSLGAQFNVNKIVGCYEHEGTNRFFVFVHGSNGVNTVYELEQSSNTFTKIAESSNLMLSGEPLQIDGIVVNDNLFLYFTDGVEEPQRINADNSFNSILPSTAFSVMKIQPQKPDVSFGTDSSVDNNNILGKSFQFALQYVFSDGEVSAIGEYSENVCSLNTLNASVVTTELEDKNFNKITIQSPAITGVSSILVPKVCVYFRDVYDNTMFKMGEFSFSELASGVDFFNDAVYSQVSDTEYNKLQDAVPRTAQAQTIAANRLFYGNYKEGFDKANVSSSLSVNYADENFGEDFTISSPIGNSTEVILGTANMSSLVGTGNDVNVVVDYTLANSSLGYYTATAVGVGAFSVYNATGGVEANITTGNVSFRVPQGTSISTSLIIQNPSSVADFKTKMAAALNGLQFTVNIPNLNYIDYHTDWAFKWEGFAVIELTASVDTNGVSIENDIIAYNLNAAEVRERTGSGSLASDYTVAADYSANSSESGIVTSVSGFDHGENSSIAYSSDFESKTFKANESHSIGVVFEDELGRTTGVYELGTVDVEGIGSRSSGSRGTVSIDSTITASDLDSSLTSFFYVYGGGSSIEKYLQFGVTEAVTAVSDSVKEQFSEDAIFVSLRSIEGKGQSINSRGGDLDTGFAQGDKLRILSYDDSGRQFPEDYVFNVAGVFVNDDDGVLSSENNFQGKGSFLVLENANHEGFGVTYVGSDNSLWESNVLVEVFTPKKQSETKIYRALPQKYPISDLGSSQNLTQGNAWYKRRLLQHKGGANRLVNSYQFVESQQYSDLDKLTIGDLGGKPYGVIDSEKEQNRISSVTYSDPQLADSPSNNLSSFNNSLANFKDFEINYGGIFGLVDMSDSLTILQSDKVSRVPLSRNILSTASGQDFVTQSTDILGIQQSYKGNFGINDDRTAFLKANGSVYLVDVSRSKIVALTEQGVKVLSDMNVSSWIEGRSDSMLADVDGYFVSIGHDRKNNEIIFSLQNKDIDNSEYSIVYSTGLDKFTTFVSYTSPFYGNLGNRFFHIRSNQVWEAETNNTYSKFFDVVTTPFIKSVFNQNPTSRKIFNAVGVDATANPNAIVSTIDQSVSIAQGAFDLKEGVFYANVPREEGTSQYVVIGEVEAESDPNITMKTRVNRLPFRLGGDVYVLDGTNTFTPLGGVTVLGVVDPITIEVTNGGAVTRGDVLAVKGASVDGDPLRGAYAEIKLEFGDTTAFELFSLSVHTSESRLHNNTQTQQ